MARTMRRWLACLMLLCGLTILGLSVAEEVTRSGQVVTLRVDGAIGPATSDFIASGFAAAAERGAGLIVIELDTPGGLDTSMRAIIKQILASPIPVATFVSPEGARAASAGTFILYASHIAAMAPATNLGAASPVAIGAPGSGGIQGGREGNAGDEAGKGDVQNEPASAHPTRGSGPSTGSTTMDKATSDAAAYLRSLAQLRGRDEDFAERAVREAASLSAAEALEAGAVDIVAYDLAELLTRLDGREVKLDSGAVVTLATSAAMIEHIAPDWRSRLLAMLSNPQLALVLMMIGIYGLFFEFTSPGFGVPGVAGLICLVVAMYAFQLLPVNWAGVALMAVGAALMLAEAFMPSFGVLGVGGVIAFIVGGLFLIDGDIPGFGIPTTLLVSVAVISAGLLFAIGSFAVKARQRRVVSGSEEMLGAEGTVSAVDANGAYAHIHGELWRVACDLPLAVGAHVRVTALEGLTLHVRPLASNNDTTTGSKS